MTDNLLIHIPHASLNLPSDFWRDVTIDQAAAREQAKFMCDYKVDELVKGINCAKIIAKYSRLYCDVERFRDDAEEPMSQRGMGTVYTHLPGNVCYRQISAQRRTEIIQTVYDQHHAKLNKVSRQIVNQSGSCLVIDLHSYSDQLVNSIFGLTLNQPDICLGYEAEWFSQSKVEKLKTYIESLGLSCAINHPYTGALVPNWAYHAKDHRVCSVMLEVNKRIYLDGETVKQKARREIGQIIDYLITL